AYDPSRSVALSVRLTDRPTPTLFKGWASRTEPSEVSGATRVTWGTEPRDLTIPFYAETRAAVSVNPPLYYVIPPQWSEVAAVLRAHGLTVKRLGAEAVLEVESFRFRDVRFAAAPFEGRQTARFTTEPVRERRTYPAGSYVVPLAQEAGRVALHLLEPEAPDSLVAWGFFNPVFEQKEYGEDYVLEKLARELLSRDENLKREFEQRLAADPKFAASPAERLRFFHERSPYWDKQLNLYPVGRVTRPLTTLLAKEFLILDF
nr:peptidase M14 [Acidobacteriota bacterium]